MWIRQIVVVFVFLLLSCKASPQYYGRPRSTLCVKSNAPCSADGSCNMLYFPINSSDCADSPFSHVKTSVKNLALGRLRINTYLYEDRSYVQTAFNLTFTHIQWTKMKFRIMQNGNRAKNTCRHFLRHENSSLTSLAYDCLWSDEGYEGKPFILDYEAETHDGTESARFVFNVPLAPEGKSKEESRLLTYVEAIPLGLARTQFHLFWPPLPQEMEVDHYRIYVYFNDSGVEKILHTFDVRDCEPDLCVFDTQKWFGEISFGVRPIFVNAIEGIISRTQYFDLGPDRVSPLLLTLVFCSIFVPILLYFALSLRKRIIQKSERQAVPKILIIHSPTTTPHLHVTEAFVNYLNTYCQVVALMDELDIPRTASRDPFEWCSDAMVAADVVCIIASPFFGKLRSSSALYRTDRLLLRLLREQYGSGGKTRYCAVLPPYTNASDIPVEASSLRKFRMIGDISKLVRMARYRWPIPDFFAPMLPSSFEQQSQELLDCIQTAETDLRDKRDEYLTQMQEPDTVDRSSDTRPDEENQPRALRTVYQPDDVQERTKEDKILAKELFSDYLGNLEHLNLLGEKGEKVALKSRQPLCDINLDALAL